MHVEEIAGAVQLLLRRGPGQFGQVSVTWQAVGMTALGEGVDFEPGSGIVTFQDLQVYTLLQLRDGLSLGLQCVWCTWNWTRATVLDNC